MAQIPGNPTWHQTMLRVSDPEASLAFYKDKMGMTLLDKISFPQYSFDLYFLTTLPDGERYSLEVGSPEAHRYLWTYPGTTLELTHNYGDNSYHAGNGEGDGFGHVAFHVDDVYAKADELLEKGVEFKKKPDEGNMKGIAFAYDPDKYWVELVKRSDGHKLATKANFSQTMLRIKDPLKSIPFYESLGMKVLTAKHFPQWKFSLYFLGCLEEGGEGCPSDDATDETKGAFVNSRHRPVLELTHNHGTEEDEAFKHNNGNEDGKKGFGHIGFLVDDVEKACDALEGLGHGFKKRPGDGNMKGLAFATDPDGYWVEIIKRGGYDADATPYYFE
ncbi:hypothetical protein TrCOL_g12663 [Triparma columacea]|uniref:Lactoylglutathione lyase n=1 Tax=Triparma columacea TaxID=722753 RepID=A0A9W7LAT1_9STRA|nr:hypothetical protein TrCOL_g12663 [Triparma columacea]